MHHEYLVSFEHLDEEIKLIDAQPIAMRHVVMQAMTAATLAIVAQLGELFEQSQVHGNCKVT
jgi:hypothetical protein